MIARIFILLTAIVAVFIVYPIGVLVPFLWNFSINLKGWIFEDFECETTEVLYVLGANEDNVWSFYSQEYPSFLHFLLAMFLSDTQSYRYKSKLELQIEELQKTQLLKTDDGKVIGSTVTDDKGNVVVDIETSPLTITVKDNGSDQVV